MSSKKDNYYLNLALDLAKDREGLTGSNPSVGAIIVKNGLVISQGQTGFGGRPHAEFNAINSCKANELKGSTMYVTLEPCTHYGKTSPCTNHIVKSKISSVVYGSQDVDERTANKASNILKRSKIKSKYRNLKKIENFYKPYKYHKTNNLPFITGKIACSKDKYINYKKNKYITNKYSRIFAHLLRYRNDGILVSYKTVNSDNPYLGCRINGLVKFSPKILILDKYLNTKLNSNIIKNAKNIKTFIFYAESNDRKIKYFRTKKAILIKNKLNENGDFDLRTILNKIYKLGISNFLLEGGKNLTELFIKSGFVNQFFLFESNKLLKNHGQLKINNILNKLNKTFKKKLIINTFVDKDRIIRYL